MQSPTSRSASELRKRGYRVAIVERWIPRANVRKDAWGMFDILCFRKDVPGVLGVQSTTASNMGSREKKLMGSPLLREWLAAGNEVVVHGWALRGKRGKRKLWAVSESFLTS